MSIGAIKRKTHFLPLLNSFLFFSNGWIPFSLIVDTNEDDEDEDADVELEDDIVESVRRGGSGIGMRLISSSVISASAMVELTSLKDRAQVYIYIRKSEQEHRPHWLARATLNVDSSVESSRLVASLAHIANIT